MCKADLRFVSTSTSEVLRLRFADLGSGDCIISSISSVGGGGASNLLALLSISLGILN